MLKHVLDKWDSYLSILLGVFLIAVAKVASLNPKLMMLFKYYVSIANRPPPVCDQRWSVCSDPDFPQTYPTNHRLVENQILS